LGRLVAVVETLVVVFGTLPILTAALFFLYHAGRVGSAGTRLQGTAPLEGVRPGLLPILFAASSLACYSREARRSQELLFDIPQPGLRGSIF
jgi:hypothetical protein